MKPLEERLAAADARVRATRWGFYRALIDWTYPVEEGDLPSLRRLLAEADNSDGTFRNHFAADQYPDLQPCDGKRLAGLERVVMEAKVLTSDPFIRGYREMTTRLHSPPTQRLASLATVVARWALSYRVLASMLPTTLPDALEGAVRTLAGSGPRAASAHVEIRDLLIAVVANVDNHPPDAQPDEILSSLRGRMAAILPLEDDLLRASRELASHVGRFMLMSEGSYSDVAPELQFVMERAMGALRLAQGAEREA